MAVIDTINVGGADFRIQDATAREAADAALSKANAVEREEHKHRQDACAFFWDRQEDKPDNTYIQSHPAWQPFVWKSFNTSTPDCSWYPNGMFMQTTTAVTAGTLIHPGVNCKVKTMEDLMADISTYVASDGKLHFKNYRGADSALNFSSIQRNGFIHIDGGDASYAHSFFDLYGLPGNTGFRFWGMRTDVRKRIHITNTNDEMIYDSGYTYDAELTFNSRRFSSAFDARIHFESETGAWVHAWYELITI